MNVTAYTSNAGVEEIVDRLRMAQDVLLLTHAKPDGDAVGGTLALARTLHAVGARATPLYLPPWPQRMDVIVGSTRVVVEHAGVWREPWLERIDAVAIVDTGSWNQVADAKAWLQDRHDRALVIDHHAHGDGDIAPLRHVDASSASACEIVARVCMGLLKVDRASALPKVIAEPLYLGVATDTGWFRYSNMKPTTLRLAADLIEAGVDHNRLYRAVEQSESPRRLMLVRRALESLEFLDEARAAVITITKKIIDECQASQDEVGGLTDLPQVVGSVRVIAVITEVEDAVTKVSFRSKAADEGGHAVDVNTMAKQFGGGGHFHAAGAKVKSPLAETRERVVRALSEVSK